MARTRSAKGTTAASAKSKSKSSNSASATSRHTLPPASENPSKLLILPNEATLGARIVSLLNPRYSKPTRYLVCPSTGVYEFTKILAPKTTPRSWLVTQDGTKPVAADDSPDGEQPKPSFQAELVKGAELYIASKIDPVFLLLPALAAQPTPTSKSSGPAKRMFLSSDDHLDRLAQGDSHLAEVLRWKDTRKLMESRMASVCDTVDAGDESMFRLSESKLLGLLLSKARRVSLPKSMHEKFVAKALEAPVLGQKSAAPKAPAPSTDDADAGGTSTPQTESGDSQSSVATTDSSTTSASDATTTATSVTGEADVGGDEVTAAIVAEEEVIKLQELRVAFNFICSNYVPPSLTATVKERLAAGSEKDVNFGPLDEYLGRLSKLRQEAMLNRSASDFSRKRTSDEDQEERAEKRRKKEEEEKKKKASESRGVRDLKKVNVAGMKKMSDFFKKK